MPPLFIWQMIDKHPRLVIVDEGYKMIAYCGLNCSNCHEYLSTQEDNDYKRKETAQKGLFPYLFPETAGSYNS